MKSEKLASFSMQHCADIIDLILLYFHDKGLLNSRILKVTSNSETTTHDICFVPAAFKGPCTSVGQAIFIILYNTWVTTDTVILTYDTPSLQVDGCCSNLPLALFVLSSIKKTLKMNVSLTIIVLKNIVWKSLCSRKQTRIPQISERHFNGFTFWNK
jgi:hypothetical protein